MRLRRDRRPRRRRWPVLAGLLAVTVLLGAGWAYVLGQGPGPREGRRASQAPTAGPLHQLGKGAGCIKGPASPSWTRCPVRAVGLQDPRSLAFSPDGRFAYATSVFASSVVAFRRDRRSGALRQLAGASGCIADVRAPAGARGCRRRAGGLLGAHKIALSPDGRNAYVASINASAVAEFSRDRRTGELHSLRGAGACIRSATATGSGCRRTGIGLGGARWVTVSPDGRNVYVSSPASDAIAAFARDPRTGALAQLAGADGCISGESAPPSVACPVKVRGLDEPRMITLSPDGRSAYAASDLSHTVNEFSRDAQTGALRPLAGEDACVKDVAAAPGVRCRRSAHGLNFAFSVTLSHDGRFAYVAAIAGDAVAAFARDPATGALSQLPGDAACVADVHAGDRAHCPRRGVGLDGASSVTISPDGRFAYVASFYGQAVAAFARDAAGGLRQLAGAGACVDDPRSPSLPKTTRCPASARGLEGPRDVVIPPDGRHAYVPVSSGGDIAVFSRGAG